MPHASLLARLVVPVCLAAFAAVYYDQANAIRSLYSIGPVGPAAYPKLLAAGLVVALVIVVVSDLRAARRADRPEDEPVDWGGLVTAGLVIAASAVYVALFRPAGYVISTGLFALALLAIYARLEMKPLHAIAHAAVLVGLVYLLFAVLFDVRLPEGPSLGALFSSGAPQGAQ